MTDEGRVGVILVNYNGFNDTCDCIDSLFSSDYGPLSIYVVDNASSDGSVDRLEARFGDIVNVISLDENLGFGAGNNFGVHKALEDGCDAVLLLNNDTVVDAHMIHKLVDEADNHTVTVPLMLYYDESDLIWYAGGSFSRYGISFHMHMREHISDLSLLEQTVSFATGCCILITRSVWERVGGFDESYFLYWEDSDLSIRFAREGVRILFCPEAVLWHKVSSSTGGEDSPLSYYYCLRNELYTFRKYGAGPLSWARVSLTLLKGLATGWKRKYAFLAWRDFLTNRMGKRL